MKLYLVINLEEEPYIINICDNEEKAEELSDTYRSNYMRNHYEAPPFDVVTVDTDDSNNGILFDVYGHYKDKL